LAAIISKRARKCLAHIAEIDVCVDGERRLDVGATEELLRDLGVYASLREQGRASVAQRMEGQPL
jgi:hypothetical protein